MFSYYVYANNELTNNFYKICICDSFKYLAILILILKNKLPYSLIILLEHTKNMLQLIKRLATGKQVWVEEQLVID